MNPRQRKKEERRTGKGTLKTEKGIPSRKKSKIKKSAKIKAKRYFSF